MTLFFEGGEVGEGTNSLLGKESIVSLNITHTHENTNGQIQLLEVFYSQPELDDIQLRYREEIGLHNKINIFLFAQKPYSRKHKLIHKVQHFMKIK